jgi:hypothetical protein
MLRVVPTGAMLVGPALISIKKTEDLEKRARK